MRSRSTFEKLLAVTGATSLILAVYFAARFGDVYRFGDSEYRRVALSDQLAYLIPAIVLAMCVGLLAFRRLCGGSIKSQMAQERELLRSARRED